MTRTFVGVDGIASAGLRDGLTLTAAPGKGAGESGTLGGARGGVRGDGGGGLIRQEAALRLGT